MTKKKEVTERPPWMCDIIWPDMLDDDYEPPRKFAGGLEARKLASFIESIDYNHGVVKSMHFTNPPHEAWRKLAIEAMLYEVKGGPQPAWWDREAYRKRRIYATDGEIQKRAEEEDRETGKHKRVLKRDIAMAKALAKIAAARKAKANSNPNG